jgi:predicted nucleotidyltransferase
MDRLRRGSESGKASRAGSLWSGSQVLAQPDPGRPPSVQEAKVYANASHPALRWLLRSPIPALAAHWLFQGLLYMGPTERCFKLALDALLTVLIAVPLNIWFRWDVAWPAALIVAHSLNFLFNGHLWGAVKHYAAVSRSQSEFESYVRQLLARIRDQPSICWAGIYGSQARGDWSQRSDVDVRLVRKRGVANGLRACGFVLAERSRALLHRFPLDLYVLDNLEQVTAMAGDEPLQVIRGRTPGRQMGTGDHG